MPGRTSLHCRLGPQDFRGVHIAPRGGQIKRRLVVLVPTVCVGTSGKQKLDECRSPVEARKVKRRSASAVHRVRVGAPVQQRSPDLDLSASHRMV